MWLAVVRAVPCWLHFLTSPPFMLVTCIPPLRSPKGWLVAANTNRPSRGAATPCIAPRSHEVSPHGKALSAPISS
ncbi:DUF983 domain-containing protein [Mesorhizobium mediterraneum]|uniref:DUF983 domain-containing protein n=1 Tax=Mesorhizobium mediterraneum TaxID=43617 RepID=UPI00178082F9